MGVMTATASLAANTVVDNILSGKTEEFLREASRIIVAATGGGADVHFTVVIGNEIVIDGQQITDATTWPVLPDNLLVEAPGLPSDRVVIRIHNRNAAARVYKVQLWIEPL